MRDEVASKIAIRWAFDAAAGRARPHRVRHREACVAGIVWLFVICLRPLKIFQSMTIYRQYKYTKKYIVEGTFAL